MNNKVVLPRDVAKAIEFMQGKWEAKAIVQFAHYSEANLRVYPQLELIQNHFGFPTLNDGFIELMSALVNGYQVAQTPEEKVLEYYIDRMNSSEGSLFRESAGAVVDTLNLLGVTIEGVNA